MFTMLRVIHTHKKGKKPVSSRYSTNILLLPTTAWRYIRKKFGISNIERGRMSVSQQSWARAFEQRCE